VGVIPVESHRIVEYLHMLHGDELQVFTQVRGLNMMSFKTLDYKSERLYELDHKPPRTDRPGTVVYIWW